MAMTKEEGAKINDIKARVLSKKPVSNVEKQWVLDLLKREQLAVKPGVKQAAKNSGFDVTGIVTR